VPIVFSPFDLGNEERCNQGGIALICPRPRGRRLSTHKHGASPKADNEDGHCVKASLLRIALSTRATRKLCCQRDCKDDVLTSHARHSTGPEASLPHINHSSGSSIHQITVTAPNLTGFRASPRQSRCRRNASAKHPACFSSRGFGDPSIVKRGFQFRASNSSDVEDVESLASSIVSFYSASSIIRGEGTIRSRAWKMVTAIWPRRRHLPAYVALSTLLCASNAKAELFYTARSPAIQDGLINKPASICPVAQDGATTDTFPWTHNPTCVDVVMPNEGNEAVGAKGPQTFCAYTNADYNNGRGVSLVVTPEVAASVTMETFGMSIGGMEGVVGENMGMWEVKYAGEKGKGLFAKKDIAGIFPGESLIVQTPVLFVARPLAETENRPQHVLKQAVEQLPAETREMVKALDVNIDGSVEDIVLTNGIGVKWPWVDELPELLAVIPEAAVSHDR
jgi:hypothetical protein